MIYWSTHRSKYVKTSYSQQTIHTFTAYSNHTISLQCTFCTNNGMYKNWEENWEEYREEYLPRKRVPHKTIKQQKKEFVVTHFISDSSSPILLFPGESCETLKEVAVRLLDPGKIQNKKLVTGTSVWQQD